MVRGVNAKIWWLKLCLVSVAISFTPAFSVAADGLWQDVVFERHTFGRPHGASLVEVREGILATWFSSKAETGSDAKIFGARWSKKTGEWTKPFVIIDSDYSKSVGNTALFRDDDGIIWLFFAAVRIGGWSGAMVDYVQSRDDGKTWSEGKNLVGWPGNLPRNLPIKIGDHEMLAPLYVDFWEGAGITGAYLARIRYKDGVIIEKNYSSIDTNEAIQPAVVKLRDGKILLLARDIGKKNIWRSYSYDNGKTWTPAKRTELPNPSSAIAALYVEELDMVLVAYNHSNEIRNPLTLAVSENGGQSFKVIYNLGSRRNNRLLTYSYPTLLMTSDKLIHVIWSHERRATLKHLIFNLDWLKKQKVSNRKGTRRSRVFPYKEE